MRRLLRRAYGTTPLHLLAHVAAFALVGYVASRLLDLRTPGDVLVWFLAAAVLQDLVLLPLYSTIDRLATRFAPAGAVNHVRVPAAIAGVLLLVFLPRITNQDPGSYRYATGHLPEDYLRNWLLIVAALAVGSALLYVVRGRRARDGARARAGDRAPAAQRPPSAP